jgi:hypothetical protein
MDDKEKSILIGFLDSMEFDEGNVFRGGCLVTDEETFPIEFRITSSIQPTSLQFILYGKSIIPYIYSELIAAPLTSKLTNEIRFIVVDKEDFLEARPKIDIPLFHIDDYSKTLLAHRDFPNEQNMAKKIQDKFSLDKLIEPFNRIESALAEAHQRNIGDD